MKNASVTMILLCLLSLSCSKKDTPVGNNTNLDKAATVDTTSISGIAIQFDNYDYGFTRVNQWSFGGFTSSYKGMGPSIDTYYNEQWPSSYVRFNMHAFFRNIDSVNLADSFKFVNLADSASIDTAVIDVTIMPPMTGAMPWAIYSNAYSYPDRRIVWVPQSTGKVSFNKYVSCPYTNPGHTFDMNVTFTNLVLTLVDSSGSLQGFSFPRTMTVKSAYFRTIKE